ncbi:MULTISPECIES: ABC transporter permease [unclassified Chelatococcus]|uniref:ABC transporter permease n=1 Tax=unclassified Chelatococcus TaxID=2638111 RepID=UPI001BCDFD22|nr:MULTISPECIES: ABC transporter permease [unclassified Chelatococcus]CAH1656392.1 Peptide/nickel transport system permease protein [Hyphomicrobiales bacterium]MBS7742461.1 ABC transporter permease [Chelatococcus sp. HY11]MBX3542421.1 ABC transporter permease [Chelatococcus sp.]MCO5075362.1 ABC transporter permease [Chelatococcus sp.]CAH1695833.1 Peptide/nickel transport system permease protein [Hyphomicrobiales bacterium]
MIAFIIKRTALMVPTMLIISAIVFVVIQLPPGDFLDTLASQLASQGEGLADSQIALLRERYGLDQSILVQYLKWITNIVTALDFGQSFEWNKAVLDVIAPRFWVTLGIALLSLALTAVVAIPCGIYVSLRQYSLGDNLATFLSFLGLAVPNVLMTLVLMYASFTLFDANPGGLFSAQYQDAPWSVGRALDLMAHLWIPVVVLATAGTAEVVRVMRATMLDELSKPYVDTARAKGLTEARLTMKYPARIAINPIVSKLGWMIPIIVSSEAVVSIVADIPTMGPLLLRSLLAQDMYLAGAIILLLAFLTVVGTLISDILLALLDPRIRHAME